VAITEAPVFLYPLIWVGPRSPSPEESAGLWEAIEVLRLEGLRGGFAALEKYATDNPASPWTPSLRANLAEYYYDHARPTPALQHWEAVWDACRNLEDANGKRVADFALAHWSRALATHGQVAALELLLSEAEGRVLDGGVLQQIFDDARRRLALLRKTPEAACRCGTYSLSQVAQALGVPPDRVIALMNTSAPRTGLSLGVLAALSEALGIPMVPALRPENDTRILAPSIIRWQLNHYAAVLSQTNGYFEVKDPTCNRVQWLTAETINSEASGYFLVLADQLPADWRRLSLAEANDIFGLTYPAYRFDDEEDEGCPTDEEADSEETDEEAPISQHDPNTSDGCQECPPGSPGDGEPCDEESGGCPACTDGHCMPVWRVSEPDINLWILDTPVFYTTSSGKRVAHRVAFRQHNGRTYPNSFNFGPGWESSHLSFVQYDETKPNEARFYAPLGSIRTYTPDGVTPDFRTGSRLGPIVGGYEINHGTGSRNVYGYAFSYLTHISRYFQTQKIDRRGRTTSLNYTMGYGSVHLTSIQDVDGQSSTFSYGDARFPNAVTNIRDPFGRTASLTYDAQGRPWRITDAAGFNTDFTYNANGVPMMTTPYGQTTFSMTEVDIGVPEIANRSILVTEPLGRKSLFLFRTSSTTFLPSEYPGEVPSVDPYTSTFCTSGLNYRNSFHWDPQQYERLSAGFRNTEDPAYLTADDYGYAHLKHWLRKRNSPELGHAINMERWPSPDGATPGQKVWFDYEGKEGTGGPQYEGLHLAPLFVAVLLPDGTSRFTRFERNTWSKPTAVTSTYTDGAVVNQRTTTYVYDGSGKNLTSVTGPDGQLRVAYTYDPNHPNCIQTLTRYAASGVGYTTTYTYDAGHRPLTRVTAAGLTTTFTYVSGGFLTQLTDSPVARTEAYTYLNGDVRTHTDYLGLTRTFTRDNLHRLTRIDFPDATSTLYGYTLLDRTSVTDRRGKTTSYVYNALRQMTSKTDPLQHTNTYTYCDCGSVESITDPLGKITTFLYDAAGRRTQVALPDNVTINYGYNPLGQLTSVTDTLGTWMATYNNQGLLATVNNAYGAYRSITYNADDQPTAVTDAAGVTVNRTFDYLGRVLTRQITGGLAETFEYSARGLIRHTDQMNKLTQYAYDQARRKTSEITPNNETVTFTYDASGDLLTLRDHRGKTTT
jgi:YD repeat-containing protein